MINTTLYKLSLDYTETLKSRIEAGFVCSSCSKIESTVDIQKVSGEWTVEATCSCGEKHIYAEDPIFRGYVIGQYKYTLKQANPDIKIKYMTEGTSYTVEAPVIDEKPKTFPDFKFSNSTVSKYKKS